jgi:hypothetical protein
LFRLARSIVAVALFATFALPTAAESPKIVVGPNILVSRDGEIPHFELMVAASPRWAKHLVGGAMTNTKSDGGIACRAYSSDDGGVTWKAREFAEQAEFGGGDPQVAYTTQGTALMVALTMNKSEKGKGCASMHIWRSEDGGSRWLDPAEVKCAPSWDHEQIVVDTTRGRFAGRIYIGALYDYPVYRVGIFRSDDDGRTWTGPVEAANGGGDIGINDVTPMVLSDGTLVVPYCDFQFKPEKIPSKGKGTSGIWFVSSTDGGVTFSTPWKVLTQEFVFGGSAAKTLGAAGFPKFAAGGGAKQFRDRIFGVWEDSRLGSTRILIAHSADRGKTWSEPKPIDGSVAAAVHQFQPAVAVNGDGVVAATWFDTRNSADGSRYDEYFTASFDGGVTFQQPVRISSASSEPRGAGNRRQMTPMSFFEEDQWTIALLSAAGWTAGGHYMGLVADKDGDFHPFWVDARSGTSQIYTARVSLAAPSASGAQAAGLPATPSLGEPVSVAGQVDIVFDPPDFDSDKNEISIPVRLRNVSTSALYPPLRIELSGFGSGQPESAAEKEFWKDKGVAIANADNQGGGEGAIFSFDEALGGAAALAPGSLTNPVVVRLKLSDPFYAPAMRWKVTGRLAKSP